MRLFMFLILMFSFSIAISVEGQDEIGLYFDENGIINCLPDLTDFPQSRDVFLVLKDCSSTSGVGGWEGAISLPVGCYMTDFNLGPNALNVATIPEFIVGFGTPMPQSPLMVLASFTLLFTAPGEVFLYAPEQNSIEGVFAPVYLEGGEQGDLVEMNYSFGDPFNAVISAGSIDCPLDTIYQDSNNLGDPEYEIIYPKEVHTIQSGHPDSEVEYPIFSDRIQYVQTLQVGLKGTVEDVSIEYIKSEFFCGGAAKLTINIDELYWGGIETGLFEVWVQRAEVPDKIMYCKEHRFPLANELRAGDEIVVFCTEMEDGAFWANRSSCFPTFSTKSYFDLKESDFEKLELYSKKFSLRTQMKESELVALLHHNEIFSNEFLVKNVYVGDKTLVGKTISIEQNGGIGKKTIEQAFGFSKNSTGNFLVMLKINPEGTLSLLNARKSFFIQTDRGWVSHGRTPFNVLSEIRLKQIGGSKNEK